MQGCLTSTIFSLQRQLKFPFFSVRLISSYKPLSSYPYLIVQGGNEDDSRGECEGWCFGDDLADFAILGGFIGYLKEEIEERKRLQRELDKEVKRKEEKSDCDCCPPSEEEPYP